ncbi:hypothetical protein TNCV_1582701 [Trichonephila clavipes]|nr:hypothetical protein TNCV_1582701 [Trichonephila clavipes]
MPDYCQLTGTLPPLLHSVVGGGTPGGSRVPHLWIQCGCAWTKSFLLAKTFLDSPLKVSPHSSLNTSCGVISEPDLLRTSEAEILYGFSD